VRSLIKIELSRAFFNKWMALSLAIGCGLALLHLGFAAAEAVKLLPLSYEMGGLPISVFHRALGMCMSMPSLIFYYVLPILAALPFVDSYYVDVRSGYIKNVFIRTQKSHYLMAKGLTVFLSSSAVIFIPLLLNLCATAMVFPSVFPDAATQSSPLNANSMWADLFFAAPYLYLILYSLLASAFAGLFSLLGLAASRFVAKRFLVLVTPFVVYFSACTVCDILQIHSVNPYVFMQPMINSFTSMPLFLAMASVLFLPVFFLFFVKGLRDETF